MIMNVYLHWYLISCGLAGALYEYLVSMAGIRHKEDSEMSYGMYCVVRSFMAIFFSLTYPFWILLFMIFGPRINAKQ